MKRLALLAVLGLAACPPIKPGSMASGFRVFYPDAENSPRGLVIKEGAHMQAKPAAQECKGADGAEARWANTGARVTTGELPPGLIIEDGAIAGVPTKAGTFRATIRFSGVTCASTPSDDKLVHVTIVVEPK
jgi:hypothetical protein